MDGSNRDAAAWEPERFKNLHRCLCKALEEDSDRVYSLLDDELGALEKSFLDILEKPAPASKDRATVEKGTLVCWSDAGPCPLDTPDEILLTTLFLGCVGGGGQAR